METPQVGQEYDPRQFWGTGTPLWLMRLENLPPITKYVFTSLAHFVGQAPQQEELAAALGMKWRTLQDHLRVLRAAGLIASRQHGPGNGAEYVFLWHSWCEAVHVDKESYTATRVPCAEATRLPVFLAAESASPQTCEPPLLPPHTPLITPPGLNPSDDPEGGRGARFEEPEADLPADPGISEKELQRAIAPYWRNIPDIHRPALHVFLCKCVADGAPLGFRRLEAAAIRAAKWHQANRPDSKIRSLGVLVTELEVEAAAELLTMRERERDAAEEARRRAAYAARPAPQAPSPEPEVDAWQQERERLLALGPDSPEWQEACQRGGRTYTDLLKRAYRTRQQVQAAQPAGVA